MPTPDELRADITAAREFFQLAIVFANANWQQQPTTGEGEEAWSARQVVEHVVKVEISFASLICSTCGYDGPENPFGDEEIQLPNAEEAQAAYVKATAAADSKIKYVTETDLEHKDKKDRTVADLLALWVAHTRDHAAQIRSASA